MADLLATGSDESGLPAGTLIGTAFPLWTQGGLTAPYGTLVGQIDGVFAPLGTSFSGPAWATGTLSLFYWDSNNADNSDSVRVTAAILPRGGDVPEPMSLTLAIAGLGALGLSLRKRA